MGEIIHSDSEHTHLDSEHTHLDSEHTDSVVDHTDSDMEHTHTEIELTEGENVTSEKEVTADDEESLQSETKIQGISNTNKADNQEFFLIPDDVTSSPVLYIGILSFILFAAAIYNRSRDLQESDKAERTVEREWYHVEVKHDNVDEHII